MIDKSRPIPIGRVVATELKPATPHQFHFWTANETLIGYSHRPRGRHRAQAGDAAPVPLLDRERDPDRYRGHRPGRNVGAWGAGRRACGVRRRDGRVRLLGPGHSAPRRRGCRRGPGARGGSADRAPGDSAVDRGSAAADPRGAAATRAARSGARGGRRRRGAGPADGRLCGRGAAHGDPDRPLHLRRTGGAGLPRRRLPARPGGGAPEHLRRLGAGDEDERRRVPAGVHLSAFPRPQGTHRRGVLQREGARSLLPRPAGRAGRGGPAPLRAAGGGAAPLRPCALFRAVQGGRREPQHAAHPSRSRGRRGPARVGAAGGPGLRRSAPQPRRHRRQGRRVHRLSRRPGAQQGLRRRLRPAPPRAKLRRSRRALPGHLRRPRGDGAERHVAHPSHRHHPQSAQPPRQHLDPLQGPGHGRRSLERPPLGRVPGPHGVRRGRRERRPARPGPRLCARRVEAARAPRAARPGRGRSRGVRRRVEQVRSRRRSRDVREEDAPRHLGAGTVPGPGAVRGGAVSLAGASAHRGECSNAGVRSYGHGRAGHAGVSGALPRDEDQARHAADRRADGASPALHAAHLRALSAARAAARPGRRGALPARGRPAVRGGRGPPVGAAGSAHPAEPGEGRDRRSHGGGCTARAGCGAARSAGGCAGLFPEGAGRSGRAAVRRARPEDALAYFRKALGARVAPAVPRSRHVVPPLNPISEEPY